MTIIDQRILIPAAPSVVWETISDINKNPHWQVDCQEISFLSSRRQGAGVRWRYVSANRNEVVVETTAWYDGLGYEYTIIDGAPVRESQGRIRLQEIPEGTIVQWSFNYEPGGLLSGLRNSLSIRRQFESTMVESLKALYTHIKKTGATRDVQEAKSLMRDALDYEARAQYVPRHPSRISEISEADKDEQPVSKLLIPEPPVEEEDTRPNPVLASSEPADSAPAIREPAEIEPAEVPAPPQEPAKSDEDEAYARFKPPAPTAAADEEAVAEKDAEAEAPAPEAEPATPAPEPAPQAEVESPSPEEDKQEISAEPDTGPIIEEFGPQLDTSEMDTREITIWEVFGVPRPSDTRPVQTITSEEATSPPETAPAPETEVSSPPVAPEATPAPQPQTRTAPPEPVPLLPYGFRIHARRKRIKIRRRNT